MSGRKIEPLVNLDAFGNLAMRTMLQVCKKTALNWVLSCAAVSATAGEQQSLSWRDGRFHRAGRPISTANIDLRLQRLTYAATVFILDTPMRQRNLFLVLVQRQTRPLPMHRCGAGTEDDLVLLRYSERKLRLLDKISVQSCEEGRTLIDKNLEIPQEPLAVIQFQGHRIAFLTTPPLLADNSVQPVMRKYRIANNHFVRE